MEQRSYAWHQARLGHITASAASVIVEGASLELKDAETKEHILVTLGVNTLHMDGGTFMTAKMICERSGESRSRVDRLLGVMIEEGTVKEGPKDKRSKTFEATGNPPPPPETKLTKSGLSYCYELISQRISRPDITGEVRQISSPALEWGTNWEPAAREAAAEAEGVVIREPVDEFAFVSRHPWIGASPDGIIGDDGLCEIQCPYSPAESVRTRIEGYEASGKRCQIQFQLWVLQRQWCLFVSYDPRFPDVTYRETVYRDEVYIDTLAQKVFAFRDYYLDLYSQLTGVPF